MVDEKRKSMRPIDVRKLRDSYKMSHSEFAEFLGVSIRLIQDWEQGGHAPNAAALVLLRLAESGELKLKR